MTVIATSACLPTYDLKQISSTLETGWYVGAGHLMCTGPDVMYRQNARAGRQTCALHLGA